jgi:hypothetical protein
MGLERVMVQLERDLRQVLERNLNLAGTISELIAHHIIDNGLHREADILHRLCDTLDRISFDYGTIYDRSHVGVFTSLPVFKLADMEKAGVMPADLTGQNPTEHVPVIVSDTGEAV